MLLIPEQYKYLAALYIDFLWDTLPITYALQITDNLLTHSLDADEKLDLSCKKALILFTYLDRATAIKIIDDALAAFKPIKKNDFLEMYSEANAYKLKYIIGQDDEYGTRAIRAYESLIPHLKACPDSTAWCEHQIGQTFFHLRDDEQALNHLLLGYKINPSSVIYQTRFGQSIYPYG